MSAYSKNKEETICKPFRIFGIVKLRYMVAVVGTYQNGYVKLDKEYLSEKPVKVIVTFLEDIETSSEKGLSLADFSFDKSRKALSDYKGSFSDTVVQERRDDL